MTPVLVAGATFLVVAALRPIRRELGSYLGSRPERAERPRRLPSPGAAAAGATAGALIGITTGDVAALGIIGAVAGLLVRRAVRSTRSEHRRARLAQELPTVADTLALYVLAGESIGTALARYVASSTGVAVEELSAALEAAGLEEGLRSAGVTTANEDASRLYDLLAHAHRTGGSLGEGLRALAVDYRASLARDITEEGGRRALTTYGPILALMIPVTLLFLMYPTLAGLQALSTAP